jgi:predicted transcriptional regulator
MKKKVNTGVTLDPDVLAYLHELGEREDRDRSWLINSIVREHASRHRRSKTNSSVMPSAKKRKKHD